MKLRIWSRAALLGALVALATAVPAAAATGTMTLRFGVVGPLDLANVRYVVLFNTNGNGREPYANPIAGLLNYSFGWVVGGTGGVAQPQLVQYFTAPGNSMSLQSRPIVVPPQAVQYVLTNGGAPGMFSLTFNRSLLDVPSPNGQAFSPIWSINFITTDLNGHPIDANGVNGVTDIAFSTYAHINTAQYVDLRYVKEAGATVVSNPSAAIAQNEVINNP